MGEDDSYMVEVQNLTKRYGKKLAVDNVSFNIEEGEILGLLGPNGAGKSTTMNIITGYIASDSGKVIINGFDISKNSLKAKSNIGYLPEQPPLYLDMTVKGYLSFIYDLKKVKLSKDDHIREICEKVGISDVCGRVIKNLSKGYKQRVGIAQALIGYPPLIILDEPTVGLDPRQIISIRNLIKSFSKDHTIIFSSHILYEVQMLCDRIIVINSGKVVSDKKAGDIATKTGGDVVVQVEGESSEVINILKEIDGIRNVEMAGNINSMISEYIIKHDGSESIRRDIFTKMASNNLPIIKIDLKENNLEDEFLKLTEELEDKEENKDDNQNKDTILIDESDINVETKDMNKDDSIGENVTEENKHLMQDNNKNSDENDI